MNRYDGPAMARWLSTRREIADLDDVRRRVLRHWAAGVHPNEETVDRFLCSVGIHLREVPTWAATGWPEFVCRDLEVEWAHDGTPYLTRAA